MHQLQVDATADVLAVTSVKSIQHKIVHSQVADLLSQTDRFRQTIINDTADRIKQFNSGSVPSCNKSLQMNQVNSTQLQCSEITRTDYNCGGDPQQNSRKI